MVDYDRPPYNPELEPSDYHPFEPLSKRLAAKLPMFSKLSLHGYRPTDTWYQFLLCRDTSHHAAMRQMAKYRC